MITPDDFADAVKALIGAYGNPLIGGNVMNRDTIVGILRHHRLRTGIRDMASHCVCGWSSKGGGHHVAHQADLLLAAIAESVAPSGFLYVARVERDTLTGEVTLVPGRDADVFEIHEGDEFVTLRCPVALFGEEE